MIRDYHLTWKFFRALEMLLITTAWGVTVHFPLSRITLSFTHVRFTFLILLWTFSCHFLSFTFGSIQITFNLHLILHATLNSIQFIFCSTFRIPHLLPIEHHSILHLIHHLTFHNWPLSFHLTSGISFSANY